MSFPILLFLKTVILKDGTKPNPRIPGAKELEIQAQSLKQFPDKKGNKPFFAHRGNETED